MSESEKLIVHSIESFGTHDGPGIRLVVFLQGCNIQCKYCQNPDTIALKGGVPTNYNDLVKRAVNMKPYFGDDGGVTVSGGEPMLQSKALIPFFEALRVENIHSNIDTNGMVRTAEAKHLISKLADLIMFDVKGTNEEEFKAITGANGLKRLIENIKLREENQKPYWLRYVLVPEYTDSANSLKFLIDTFSENKYLEKLEILPYHKLGNYKWESLGIKYEFEDVSENSQEQIEDAFKKLKPHFKDVIVK